MTARPLAAGLGKGLGSLIPQRWKTTTGTSNRPEPVREVQVSAIVANPLQPRQAAGDGIEELAASIREHGILQPLVVQPKGDRYELIAGERRLRAARSLGLTRVPVVVRTVSAQQQLELALVENLQRKDLNPIEEAIAYQRLINEFNLTQEQVARKVGRSRSHVANVLRLPSLPEPIVASLAKGEISEGHAKVLLSFPSAEEQLKWWREIVRRHLPVRSIEGVVQTGSRPNRTAEAPYADLVSRLQERFQTRVAISGRQHRGKITFAFFSKEELQALVGRFLGKG